MACNRFNWHCYCLLVLFHTCSGCSSWSARAICNRRLSRLRIVACSRLFHTHYHLRTLEAKHCMIIADSTITCPECGHSETETMPTNACQWFYDCKGCGVVLKPKKGDCCVYCSYGTVACPPIQEGVSCCS